jgi:hypothetical protein
MGSICLAYKEDEEEEFPSQFEKKNSIIEDELPQN